jgi:endonuclease YncB( thermonuclease family)
MVFRSRFKMRRRPLWRRIVDGLAAAALIGVVAFAAVWLEQFSAGEITGQMRVVDGDSLAIGKRRLRLKGIDAPELKQRCRRDGFEYPCGLEAASYLRGLIGGSQVRCLGEGVDRYGRDLVRCNVNSLDLNQAMVRAGQAVAFGDYRGDEAAARAEQAGLWGGEFDLPKQWRAVHGGLIEDLHGGWNALRGLIRRFTGM